MKIQKEQFEKIAHLMPLARGSVTMSHLEFLNALLYVIENGCKWRALPESLGKWDTVYRRANRWAKNGLLDIGKTRGGWNTKLHVVAANDKVAVGFLLSSGEAGDAPKGRELLEKLGHQDEVIALLMDKAHEGDETRALAIPLGYEPVVSPNSNRNGSLGLRQRTVQKTQ